MKKWIVAVFFGLALELSVSALAVGGVVATNTIWAFADSPVIVTSAVQVATGATLTIEPGVAVRLGSAMGMIVANGGRLLAEGTTNAPILFTRSGTSGYWGNLVINGAIGSPETRIAHARFEFNANSTGTPCIQVAAGTVFLDHLTFGNTGAPYIHVDGASFIISHCEFPSGTAVFEPCHGTRGVKSGGHGIFLRNFFGKPIGYSDVVDFTGGQRPGPIVQFIENVLIGGDDDGFDIDGTDAWVEGNIFLHFHRNAGTPDSSSAVSGGAYTFGAGDPGGVGLQTSQITIVGNIMYDCDQATAAKEGNFYTLINNTIVHQSHQGGVDGDGAVVILADAGTAEAAGLYLEGNIIFDVEKLVRNLTAATVTFTNNLMPSAWNGPGGGNSTNDPMLKYVPLLSETVFTNWQQAQILHEWFSLSPGSPALGSGPDGRDKGGVIPPGAVVQGAPMGSTTNRTATLSVGFNRKGSGIPSAGFPFGSGYTDYRWRMDTNDWSAEVSIDVPIALTNLDVGPHYVEVIGKNDAGVYQNDLFLAEAAVITRSRVWTVVGPPRIERILLSGTNRVEIQFTVEANTGYMIERRESLSSGTWQAFVVLDPAGARQVVTVPDSFGADIPTRYYRVLVR